MLQTQVNYWTLQEAKRHNIITENLGYATLDETKRHNISVENYNTAFLNETSRHNREQENLGYETLNENIRHNVQTEKLGFQTLNETIRHNTSVENESKRHNQAEEYIAKQNVSLGYANVNLGYANLANDKARTEETTRTNKVNESISARNAQTNFTNAESSRITANAKASDSAVNRAMMPTNIFNKVGTTVSSMVGSFTNLLKVFN